MTSASFVQKIDRKFSALRLACLAASVIAVTWWGSTTISPSEAGVPRIDLANGASSPQALVQALLAALAANDRKAVEALAVDEREYRVLIMPGSVKPGRPPQIMPDDKSSYFWRMMATRSLYSLNSIMAGHGGKNYRLKSIDYQKVEPFAWYVAHRDPVLHLQLEDGSENDLKLGTIAEYNGRFKFISYWSD